jgi:hypothetical protein
MLFVSGTRAKGRLARIPLTATAHPWRLRVGFTPNSVASWVRPCASSQVGNEFTKQVGHHPIST